jgi:hypothetical protein
MAGADTPPTEVFLKAVDEPTGGVQTIRRLCEIRRIPWRRSPLILRRGGAPTRKGPTLNEMPQQAWLLSQEEFALLTIEEKMSYLARAILSLGTDQLLRGADIEPG